MISPTQMGLICLIFNQLSFLWNTSDLSYVCSINNCQIFVWVGSKNMW